MSVDVEEHSQTEDVSALDQSIQDKYRTWKKNSPFLYDYISTYSVLWPSLNVQFFPDLEKPGLSNDVDTTVRTKKENDILQQRLLLGTFTSGQAVDNISIVQLSYYENLNKNLNIDKLNYNPDKSEFELTTVSKNKLTVLQKINHFGDVNKLVYMPQNPDVLASGNNVGDLVIYNRTKHSSYKTGIDSVDINKPDLTLRSASVEESTDIFAIDWNKQREGSLVSGNMNGFISLYDIKTQYSNPECTSLGPLQTFEESKDGINDIQWIPDHDSMFYSVDEAGTVKLFDTRTNSPVISSKINDNPINTISINPKDLKYAAMGDSKGRILIFDIRNLKTQGPSLFEFEDQHEDSITRIKWHPHYHNVLATSSADTTVKIFDLGKYKTQKNALVFVHSGHMLGVNDFDWSLHDKWMVASVADDNSLHIWKPSYDIIKSYA